LTRSAGVTGSVNISEGRINNVSKLSGVTNHLVVSTLLVSGKSELVPDVHPVAILTVDALTTDLNLNLRDELLTGAVQPTGKEITGRNKSLADLRKSHLKIGTVGKITVAADGTGHAATEIGLTVESLLNRFHGKVSVASVGHLPESNLGITSKVNVLCAIGD